MNYDFYKNKFEREQKRRVDLDNSMNLPILVSTLIMGLNSYVLKEHMFSEIWNFGDWIVISFLSISLCLIMVSCYFIFSTTNNLFNKNKFFKGIDYPNFELMKEYRKFELDNFDCVLENKIDMEKVIVDKTIMYADEYTEINEDRAENMSEARKYLIINFTIVIINISFVTIINLLK